jgi:hypothetical protein
MKKAILALSVLTFALTISLLSQASLACLGPNACTTASTSQNWSGYAVETSFSSPKSGAVSDVKGQWKVPAVKTTVTPNAYSAFWVGIDGYSSGTVEQVGTLSDSSSGVPSYYAWYEMYPKYLVIITMKIHVGDVMSAEVKYIGSYKFKLSITDVTTAATFSTTQTLTTAKRSSAEWIAEAPSSSSGVLPLSDFGTVYFSHASATLNGHVGTISDSSWHYVAITMKTSGGTTKAKPSGLYSSGTSFSVTWYHK